MSQKRLQVKDFPSTSCSSQHQIWLAVFEINCGRHFSEFLQNKWTHKSTSSLSNSFTNLASFAWYMFHSSYKSNGSWDFIPAIFLAFWNQGGSHKRGRPRATVNQHTPVDASRWMPVITQLWMNLNWVNILFYLGDQSVRNRSHI
jgi:hypothetical protein